MMFDREGVKIMKAIQSLSILFSRVKSKIEVTQKTYEVKGCNMHNSNQFTTFQNLLYNFFK